jgi:RIO kinase 1
VSRNIYHTYDLADYDESDKFEVYAEQFDPLKTDRQARRKRKPKAKHIPKKSKYDIVDEIADTTGVEGEFTTTYQPARFEAEWLLASLRSFYDEDLISDILAVVKGGKEATVYRCQAHPATGLDLLAAKVYRPRQFRNLRNDKMYKEGRTILTAEGRPVKTTDHRIARAVGKKTAFGVQVEHTSWLMYEYTTLERLHQAGAVVPRPIASNDNAILMGYCGDERIAAPTLHEVTLERPEATRLFQETLRNIELMLQHNLIHGDLSAYNILYWEGTITLIDFPQVTSSQNNRQARFILQRDITRVCDYFAAQGVYCKPKAITDDLWRRYIEKSPHERAADESRLLGEDWVELAETKQADLNQALRKVPA